MYSCKNVYALQKNPPDLVAATDNFQRVFLNLYYIPLKMRGRTAATDKLLSFPQIKGDI